MLLTDIDNIMYKIEAENDYEDFYKEIALCDFRNYQKIQNIAIVLKT